jgi:hypothetical protein
MQQVEALKPVAEAAKTMQQEAGLQDGIGLQIEFKSQPRFELAFESLSRENQGIELLNLRHGAETTFATVFVPDGKLKIFENLIQDYIEEKKDKNGHARDHKSLLNTIDQIRVAAFEALWTDAEEVLPQSEEEELWWEAWLPVRGDRTAVVNGFRAVAEKVGFQLSAGELQFPERTVLLMRGSKRQIQRSMLLLNNVAELRRAKETAEFFDALTPLEQQEWVNELKNRLEFNDGDVPHVCLLDSGINNGHPLLQQSLSDPDLHTVEPEWGSADVNGHGTGMAGIALLGDLTEALSSNEKIPIGHRLESVKLVRNDGDNEGRHHGNLTVEAIARSEIQAPERRRVFGMAITAKDGRDRGRPSAWSAAVDRLAVDYDGEGLSPRLIVVSAGNVRDHQAWADFPASNTSDSIHDPGQAWNALTVGAYTEKAHVTEPDTEGYQAIATAGALSPFSTTSATWENFWPLKPDVVLEGGNAAKDAIGAVWMPSLSLLTTHHRPAERLLTTTNATSAASALAARMAAQLMAGYPDLWPETVRALIVHSAEWTPQMEELFLDRRRRARDYRHLIRHCGFGVPNLERALWSAANSLTLIVQDELQPFEKPAGKAPKTKDMHLHRLPWPIQVLEDLGETAVQMRVTLSYFIEPNPGVAERGIKGRYRYESHGLRFEVKRPTENEGAFRARINQRARDEDEGSYTGGGSDPGWRIGPNLRHVGSIHSDVWSGTAAQLAARGMLAVYPALGWWKTLLKAGRTDKKARYGLVVSIQAPSVDVDLYNAVRLLIASSVTIET